MPDFGMRLGQGQYLVLQQDQRLEQRLEQRLIQCCKLALLGDLDTEGGKDVAHEVKILTRMHADIKAGVYLSLPDFLERVGKRVSKKDRTDGTREIVTALRSIATSMQPPLVFMQGIVAAATIIAKSAPPSEELTDLASVLSASGCQEMALRVVVCRLWEATAAAEADGYIPFLQVMRVAAVSLEMDADAFRECLTVLTESESNLTNKVAQELLKLNLMLPVQPRSSAVRRAMCATIQFEALLGHLQIALPEKKIYDFATSTKEDVGHLSFLLSALLGDESPSIVDRVLEFVTQDSYTRTIDNQRHVAHAVYLFAGSMRHHHVLHRMVELAKNASEFAKLCAAGVRAASLGVVKIPNDFTTGEEAIKYMNREATSCAFLRLPFSEGGRHRIEIALDRADPYLVKIFVSLAAIYEKTFQEGLPLLAELIEHAFGGTFDEWRYNHSQIASQLGSAKASLVWKENVVRTRFLASRDEICSRLDALRLLQQEAKVGYLENFKEEWKPERAGQIEAEIWEFDDRLRNPKTMTDAKRTIVSQKTLLRSIYHGARLVELFDIHPDYVATARDAFRERLREPWIKAMMEPCQKALQILDTPELSGDRSLSIMEKDDPRHLLDVGVRPVLSCQRWTEQTVHNMCLLAYGVDANKKVWYFATRKDPCIARVVVRLIPFKKSVLLLLEPVYSIAWSSDHSYAFILTVLEKAGAMSRELGKPVYVGYTGWKKCAEWTPTFKRVAEELKGVLKTAVITLKLPDSRNGIEYSDSLGGKIANGAEIPAKETTYITIDTAAEDEA